MSLFLETPSAQSFANAINGMNNQELLALSSLIGAGLGVVASVTFICTLAICVLKIIGKWKVFTKMNEKGWKAIIPFYSDYVLYGKIWDNRVFFVEFIASILVTVIGNYSSKLSQDNPNPLALVVLVVIIACAIIIIVIAIKKAIYISKSFGKGALIAVLYFLFPFFTYLILGFGSAKYIGNKSK